MYGAFDIILDSFCESDFLVANKRTSYIILS